MTGSGYSSLRIALRLKTRAKLLFFNTHTMNLTPEQINTAIAEFCGWTNIRSGPSYPLHGYLNCHRLFPIPNYHGDLNACRKALSHLLESQQSEYQKSDIAFRVDFALTRIMATQRPRLPVICATAPQICEALLRTIGKWPPA